jgi:hypothetical protein
MLNFKQQQEVRRNMRKYIYETKGQGSISRICFPNMLKELVNYKPKNMSQENKQLTPEVLINELGWEFVEQVPYDNRHPMSLFKKSGTDCPPGAQCSDHFTYLWTLYVPPFNYFGTWKGCEFIIEQEMMGGFFGTRRKYPIFHGYLETIEDYKSMCKLTKLK